MKITRLWNSASNIKGDRGATITLAYNHCQKEIEDVLNNVQHEYLDIIRSSVHIHMENNNCVEVLILQDEAGKIREIHENIVKNKGVQQVKLDTINPNEILGFLLQTQNLTGPIRQGSLRNIK